MDPYGLTTYVAQATSQVSTSAPSTDGEVITVIIAKTLESFAVRTYSKTFVALSCNCYKCF